MRQLENVCKNISSLRTEFPVLGLLVLFKPCRRTLSPWQRWGSRLSFSALMVSSEYSLQEWEMTETPLLWFTLLNAELKGNKVIIIHNLIIDVGLCCEWSTEILPPFTLLGYFTNDLHWSLIQGQRGRTFLKLHSILLERHSSHLNSIIFWVVLYIVSMVSINFNKDSCRCQRYWAGFCISFGCKNCFFPFNTTHFQNRNKQTKKFPTS